MYHNAFLIELRKTGFDVKSQYPVRVYYDDFQVGDYYADIIVDDCIIIENKAMEVLREEHEYQLINYLKATEIEVGLLFNFGKNLSLKENILQMTESPTIPVNRTRMLRMVTDIRLAHG